MKLRIGMSRSTPAQDDFWEIVTRAIAEGVDALVIHGRTVSERFRGKADWDAVAAVKARFPAATILGSGDIFDASATVELMQRTRLDGFVVARGAIGNPWIFRDLRCVWEGRPLPPPPDLAEQRLLMLEHLDRILGSPHAKSRMQGSGPGNSERWGVGYFRKFMIYYVRRHPKRKQVVLTLIKAKTRAEVEAGINAWYGVPNAEFRVGGPCNGGVPHD